ncbi:MAG: hypothetical protein ACKO1M_01040, partial [Planctomycetota bacterium]
MAGTLQFFPARGFIRRGVMALSLAAVAAASLAARAQEPQGPGLVPHGGGAEANSGAGDATAAVVGQHPLEPALELAQRGLASLRANVKDYSCTMVKREL